MDDFKRMFNAYANSPDYAPHTKEAERLHDEIFSLLGDMLPNKEYGEIEDLLNAYSNMVEEKAYITGFRTAMRLITGSIQQ